MYVCVWMCVGGVNNGLNIPTLLPRALVCLTHSFPHSSLPSWTEKKKLLLLLTRGRGLSEHLIMWTPPHNHHSSLFYLVSEAAKLQEKKGGGGDVTPPFCRVCARVVAYF